MKTYLTYAIVALLLISLPCCKKDSAKPSQEQRVTTLLIKGTGKWTPSLAGGVTVEGLDVTEDLFKDFSITFTADKFFTTGTTPVFLREDTWRFKDDTATIILRGQDDKEITVETVSENELQLSLEWDQTTYEEGGRTRSIPGTVVFTMTK
jgi:hypothetical protein